MHPRVASVLYELSGVSPSTGAFFRCLYALIPLGMLVLVQRRRSPRPSVSAPWIVKSLLAGAFLGIDLVLWHESIHSIGGRSFDCDPEFAGAVRRNPRLRCPAPTDRPGTGRQSSVALCRSCSGSRGEHNAHRVESCCRSVVCRDRRRRVRGLHLPHGSGYSGGGQNGVADVRLDGEPLPSRQVHTASRVELWI